MESSPRHFLPTNEIANCPWTFVRNIDQNRVPDTLWEAKCACECGVNITDCRHYRCMPVYTYIKVLKRVGCTEIREEFFPLAVGCTQVRRIPRTPFNEMLQQHWRIQSGVPGSPLLKSKINGGTPTLQNFLDPPLHRPETCVFTQTNPFVMKCISITVIQQIFTCPKNLFMYIFPINFFYVHLSNKFLYAHVMF